MVEYIMVFTYFYSNIHMLSPKMLFKNKNRNSPEALRNALEIMA